VPLSEAAEPFDATTSGHLYSLDHLSVSQAHSHHQKNLVLFALIFFCFEPFASYTPPNGWREERP
jgi:hypothetical protein